MSIIYKSATADNNPHGMMYRYLNSSTPNKEIDILSMFVYQQLFYKGNIFLNMFNKK